MHQNLEVMVTSGGIGVKIDDIRKITNSSRGVTGALIAEEFLKKGARVHYISERDAKKPFLHRLLPSRSKPIEEEIDRIEKEAPWVRANYLKYRANLVYHETDGFNDYLATVERVLTDYPIDVAVMNAAVADYGMAAQEGKISSDKDELKLTLTKNPKVIARVKQIKEDVFLVGFKLLTGPAITQEMIDVAYRSGIKNHANLTALNSVEDGDLEKRQTVFITPEKGITSATMPQVAPKLVELIYQRFSRSHFHTKLTVLPQFGAWFEKDIAAFKEAVKELWQLNLFEPYFTGEDDCHFGFVAKRVAGNAFLTTTRASDKHHFTEKDLVLVNFADWDKKTLEVSSLGKKASLNASVPAKIFEERPEINWIVHSHVFPGFPNQTSFDPAPGTAEEIQEIMRCLKNGERSVEIPKHGIIVLAKDLSEIKEMLDSEPAYTRYANYYDLIYGRFQKSTGFVDFVLDNMAKDTKVLDLAGGTGDVTWQLGMKGFYCVILADKNKEMLEVARKKMPGLKVYVTEMENLQTEDNFDAILIRQAVNYIKEEDLVVAFSGICDKLRQGGKFIFNAPLYAPGNTYPDKHHEYEAGGWHIDVLEMNLLNGAVLTHTQRCTLTHMATGEIKKIYDMNTFTLYTEEQFKTALILAGFRKIDFKNTPKTLYCSAIK